MTVSGQPPSTVTFGECNGSAHFDMINGLPQLYAFHLSQINSNWFRLSAHAFIAVNVHF